MGLVKFFFSSLILLNLTACAGTYRSYVDMLDLAFTQTKDVELSLNDVKQAPSDLLYVRNGERSVAAMALYKMEGGQHKWVSADNAMLVMQQGRIVRTLGFSNDLLYLTNTASDPLLNITKINSDSSWLRLADWQSGEYGYAVRSQFEVVAGQTLRFFATDFNVTLVIEHLQYDNKSHYMRFDSNWQNRFWFDTTSGTLIKSEQTLAPFGEPISMTYISRIARLLPATDTVTTQVNDDAE